MTIINRNSRYTYNSYGNIDVGVIKEEEKETASLGDRVFFDANSNGIQDAGEISVAGVPITVEDRNGMTQTTVSDANGMYIVDGLTAGDYKITVNAPNGFNFSPVNQGTNNSADSNINPNTGMSDFITLNPGENNSTIDVGLTPTLKPTPAPMPTPTPTPTPTASVGDRVFNDANRNGIQDAGESGISGATVILQTPNSTTVSTTTTDTLGVYNFSDLTPGDYKVTFIQPDGFNSVSPFQAGGNSAFDSDANPNNSLMSDVFSLSEGQVRNDIDAGFFEIPENVNVDLSVNMTATGANSNKAKIQASGTLKHTITVTNNSNETATGVVVGTDLQVAMDVWEPGQTQTEYGTDWVNASTAEKREDRFFGNPGTIDSTNGTVTVNDVPMAGIAPEKSDIDIETLDRGELIWELGTPLAPGETATLSFHGQRTFEKVGGVDFHQTASLIAVDQQDINPANNQQIVAIKFETPIALDLNGDGIQTLSIDEGVEFDLLNTGTKVNTGWLSGEDALLAVDNNGNGVIDDRSELFGGAVGEGFAKLSTFDSNDDGLVNADDANFGLLQVWQDANENGVTDTGELVALEGTVAALSTDYTNVFELDAQGNIHGETSSATLQNGTNIDLVDIYFQVQA